MWYVVCGRVPFDDEDSVLVFQADDHARAVEQFAAEMNVARSQEEIAECDERTGAEGGVYITAVLVSDTEIRYE